MADMDDNLNYLNHFVPPVMCGAKETYWGRDYVCINDPDCTGNPHWLVGLNDPVPYFPVRATPEFHFQASTPITIITRYGQWVATVLSVVGLVAVMVGVTVGLWLR